MGSIVSELVPQLVNSCRKGNLSASINTATQSRSQANLQNIARFKQYEIGKLSTGERLLRVPVETIQQNPFREAVQQFTPRKNSEIYRPRLGTFIWDGGQLLFAGYDAESISDFKVGNQSYWVTRVRGNDGRIIEVSQSKFVNPKAANINSSGYQFIREFKQDRTKDGFFYATTIAGGNGWNFPVITYLIDLRITARSPNQNVIVCESSRYTQLRKGQSPTTYNPDCKTGQQVTAKQDISIKVASIPNVPTWNQFVKQGGNRFIQVDYNLPNEFRNGYVYFTQGASVIYGYIFKSGLPNYPPVTDRTIPNFEVGDRYVNSGQAIRFFWNLGNSGLRYQNNEVRFPEKGTVCLGSSCLRAPSMNNAQITRILRSKRSISKS